MPKSPSAPVRKQQARETSGRCAALWSRLGSVPARWLLLFILLLAGYLRLAGMEQLLWGNDPADATWLAARMALGEAFPQHGLMFSVGVWQTPLEVYLIAPFMVFSRDPVWFPICWAVISVGAVFLTYLIGRQFLSERAGLIAAALFAVAPWPVMFSRQAWAQGMVHTLAVPLFWMWARLLAKKGSSRDLFWVVLLTLAAAQIHVAAFSLIALFVILWALFRFPLNGKAIALAVGLHLVSLVPYLGFQFKTGWKDVQRAVEVVHKSNESEVYTVHGVHPQWGFPLPSRQHLTHLFNLVAGRQFEEFNGLDQMAFTRSGLMPLYTLGTSLLRVGAALAVLALGVFLVRQAKPSHRFPFADLREYPLLTAMFLWVIWPVLFFWLTGLRSYLTYFSFVFPVPFLVIGWSFECLFARIDSGANPALKTVGRTLCWALLAGMVFSGAGVVTSLYAFWGERGGARGTRGESYIHQLEMAAYIANVAPTTNPALSSDWPARTPVHRGLQYLLWWKLRERENLPTALRPASVDRAFVVIDRRFSSPQDPMPEPLARMPYKTFGPLRLYEIPSAPSGSLQ